MAIFDGKKQKCDWLTDWSAVHYIRIWIQVQLTSGRANKPW